MNKKLLKSVVKSTISKCGDSAVRNLRCKDNQMRNPKDQTKNPKDKDKQAMKEKKNEAHKKYN
jgi:hypothetical protein